MNKLNSPYQYTQCTIVCNQSINTTSINYVFFFSKVHLHNGNKNERDETPFFHNFFSSRKIATKPYIYSKLYFEFSVVTLRTILNNVSCRKEFFFSKRIPIVVLSTRNSCWFVSHKPTILYNHNHTLSLIMAKATSVEKK